MWGLLYNSKVVQVHNIWLTFLGCGPRGGESRSKPYIWNTHHYYHVRTIIDRWYESCTWSTNLKGIKCRQKAHWKLIEDIQEVETFEAIKWHSSVQSILRITSIFVFRTVFYSWSWHNLAQDKIYGKRGSNQTSHRNFGRCILSKLQMIQYCVTSFSWQT